MRRLNTLARKQVREEVIDLLKKAEETKSTSYPEAIKMLYEAAEKLPQLAVDNTDKKSDRNITQNKNTQEIMYMSKRGHVLYDLKDYEKAQQCYEFIRQKLPNNTEVHKALGDCLRKLKRFTEASAMYERGLVVYEKDDLVAPNIKAALLNSRGLNYMEQGKYAEARKDFDAAVKMTAKNPNPLYHCNRGYAIYALNDKDEALKAFEEANNVVQTKELKGLTEENVEYIKKTLREFLKGLEELRTVDLAKQDVGVEARELGYIKENLDALTGSEESEEGDKSVTENEEEKRKAFSVNMAAKIAKLKRAKVDIQKIHEPQNKKLFEYYDGFMFTLAQSYKTAVIINSGQVLYDTSVGTEIDILTSAIKLVPLVGSQLSEGIHSLATFAKNAQVTKAATNICKFATTESMFNEIVQDALLEVVQLKQGSIKAQQEKELSDIILPKWASRYQKIVDKVTKLKGQVDEVLYGDRNETPLQKLGYQTANTLISDYVANGAIYNGELAIRVPKEEKQKRLTKIAKELFDKSLDPKQQPQQAELSADTESRATCESCSMF